MQISHHRRLLHDQACRVSHQSVSQLQAPNPVHMPPLTAIGRATFYGCSSLAAFTFPTGLVKIGASAFHSCTALTDLRIPGTAASMDDNAFSGCTALQIVSMESTAVRFLSAPMAKPNHFSSCTSLTAIYVPDTNVNQASSSYLRDPMFRNCSTPLLDLRDAATPDMQLQFYWRHGSEGHALCSHAGRMAVFTVLLIEDRYSRRWSKYAASSQGAQQTLPRLPHLPDDIWFCTLALISDTMSLAECTRMYGTLGESLP